MEGEVQEGKNSLLPTFWGSFSLLPKLGLKLTTGNARLLHVVVKEVIWPSKLCLYTNIPHEEAVTTVCHAYEDFYGKKAPIPSK